MPAPLMRALGGVLLAAALATAGPAVAQSVRCESPDGRITYSNTDCPPGSRNVRVVPPAPPPNAADAKAARERARDEQKRAQSLDRQRQAADDKATRERAAQAKKDEARERDCRKLAIRVEQAQRDLDRATLAKRSAAEKRLADARAKHDAACPR